MTVGWVAATTRGRSLVGRLVGPEAARALAVDSWPDARRALATTMYGNDLPPDADRRLAGRAAAEAAAWQLRVLAGWLPPGQGVLARLFAAPMEIANIESHLAELDGGGPHRTIRLGSLAVAWPRIVRCSSPEQVRSVLAASVWGDPGGTDRATMALGLRVALARRLARQTEETATWANGGAAVLVARERFAFDREIADLTATMLDGLLGRKWRTASTIPALAQRLPKSAAWSLADIGEPTDIWRAEQAVARRVAADAGRMVSGPGYRKAVLVGVMALLLTDLRQVLAAVEVAGRGPLPAEVLDAVA
jgi:hypothetical protein